MDRPELALPIEKAAYFAGLFDGEGCVGVYHQTKERSSCLRVQVVQNKKRCVTDAFAELVNAFGGRVRFQTTRTMNIKCCYDVAGDAGCSFLEAIFPYVIFKREQVALGIAWHRQRKPRKRDWHGRVVVREDQVIVTDYHASELSRYLKIHSLDEVFKDLPHLGDLAMQLCLPEMLGRNIEAGVPLLLNSAD